MKTELDNHDFSNTCNIARIEVLLTAGQKLCDLRTLLSAHKVLTRGLGWVHGSSRGGVGLLEIGIQFFYIISDLWPREPLAI